MIFKLKVCVLMVLLLACHSGGEIEEQQEANSGISVNETYRDSGNIPFVNVNTFKVDSGWGYDIVVNGKRYIHQKYIPAVQGIVAFSSEEDAMKTAGLVKNKLIKGRKLPTVTVQELDSLGVKH